MKTINIEFAKSCLEILESGIVFEGNSRGINLQMGFHVSNEELLARIPSKTMKLESFSDAAEIISYYDDRDFKMVLEELNTKFLNEIDIYKPLFIHFMSIR